MIVFHVTTFKKLKRIQQKGFMKAPVRAWVDINDAVGFSIQTGRFIILRLRFPDKDVELLDGHKGRAVVCKTNIDIKHILGEI